MRTPVATLEAYLEASEDGIATLDAGTAEPLRSRTRRLAPVVRGHRNRLLDGGGTVRLDLRTVAPESVISAAVEWVTEAHPNRGVRLVIKMASALPERSLDPERMGQVLANLLDNALRHTPVGGLVTISATPRAGVVALTVADTGEGIPADHLARIFERFYRVDAAPDRAHEGSGMGLAIAKTLVEGPRRRAHRDQPEARSGVYVSGSPTCPMSALTRTPEWDWHVRAAAEAVSSERGSFKPPGRRLAPCHAATAA